MSDGNTRKRTDIPGIIVKIMIFFILFTACAKKFVLGEKEKQLMEIYWNGLLLISVKHCPNSIVSEIKIYFMVFQRKI